MTQVTMKQAGALTLTAVAAFTLQGCVAAAFPLAAGGIIGERSLSRGSDARSDASADADPAQVSTNPQVVNSDLAPVESEPATAAPPATRTSADFNAAFAEPRPASVPPASVSARSNPGPAPDPTPVTAPNAAAPRPPAIAEQAAPAAQPSAAPVANAVRPLPTPVPSAREPLGPSGINQLLSYANSRQIASEEVPYSAMLSDRVALEPVKAECEGVSPTILIDLDPENGLFDSTIASRPPSGLARGLARLRQNGVSVAWISGNGIDKLDAIKRALTYSGLDLANEDRVLLIRSPDDRKQTLREELSQISCLVAIAGDTRSDFDELYDYLKNPADAKSLEPLIGDGWFLIPQPLL